MKDFTPDEIVKQRLGKKREDRQLSDEEAREERNLRKIKPEKSKRGKKGTKSPDTTELIQALKEMSNSTEGQEMESQPVKAFDLSGLSEDTQKAIERRKEHLTRSNDTKTLNLLLENPEVVLRADLEILKTQPESKRNKEDIAGLRKILGELVRKRLSTKENSPVAPSVQKEEPSQADKPTTPEVTLGKMDQFKKELMEKGMSLENLDGQSLEELEKLFKATWKFERSLDSFRDEDEAIIPLIRKLNDEIRDAKKAKESQEAQKGLEELLEIIEKTRQEMAQTTKKIKENDEMIAQLQKELDELDNNGERRGQQESQESEIKIYPKTYIEDKLLSLLESSDKIDAIIEKPKIAGKGAELILKTRIKSTFEVGITATLVNKGNGLTVKDYKIEANMLARGRAEKKLSEFLDKVSDLLKEYIGQQENKVVQKIEIDNGELKVTFKN